MSDKLETVSVFRETPGFRKRSVRPIREERRPEAS